MRSKFNWLCKAVALSLVMLMLSSSLSACSEDKKPETKEKKVLRIGLLYEFSEEWFRKKYVDFYEQAHPNVTVEISYAIKMDMKSVREGTFQYPDSLESMKKLMSGDNPVDVVVLNSGTMTRLIDNNLVKQLDPLIQQDKFDTTDIVPGVMEVIKQMSGNSNNIHALIPVFQPYALFYNKGIFQKAGVELPKDGMTFDEIFSLARRVTRGEGKNQISGINLTHSPGSAFDNMRPYIAPLGLEQFDGKGEHMTVNTPQWEKAWETLSKLYQDKVLYNNPAVEYENGTPVNLQELSSAFISGKVAMEIANPSLIEALNSRNDSAKMDKKLTPVDWGVVTPPVHPDQPEIGGSIYISEAMAINNNAPEAALAWDFIKSVNSPEWAKVKGKSLGYEMVTRKSLITPMGGLDYNVGAFYQLKPPSSTTPEGILSKKPGLPTVLNDLVQPIFQSVLDGKKTVKEGLAEWEKKGNEVLKYLEKDPKATFKPDGTPVPSKNTDTAAKG